MSNSPYIVVVACAVLFFFQIVASLPQRVSLKSTDCTSDLNGSDICDTEVGKVTTSSNGNFREYALELHNALRASCTLEPLKLNESLNVEADKWAGYQLKQYKLAPIPQRPPYNVFSFTQNQKLDPSVGVKLAIDGWYSDKNQFDWNKPKATGYSQIVWKSTTDIGVGFASKEGKSVVVVTYSPPGNLILLAGGDSGMFFKDNVPKSEC